MIHEIKIDSRKQVAGIILSILFIIGGTILLINPLILGSHPFKDEAMFAISMTVVIIFLMLLIFLIYKIVKKTIGLIINEEGIQEQISAFAVGMVRWEEMSGFGIKKQIGIPFIVIYLKDKEQFIERFSGLKKTTIKKNTESFGTPVAISTVMLKMNREDLKQLFIEVGAKHGLKFED
ncbi:MAG: ABC-type multidrug transport system fused ATPase/permease subunit [Crocinitomix sp.]|jgi:ABC-type multidrug transport system fused ATPase/permease subunit